jgi:hypothetical protein
MGEPDPKRNQRKLVTCHHCEPGSAKSSMLALLGCPDSCWRRDISPFDWGEGVCWRQGLAWVTP